MQVKSASLLRQAREAVGISQREVSRRVGCTQATISLLERGLMTTCTEGLALHLSRHLHASWEDLFTARVEPYAAKVTNDKATECQGGQS